MIENNMKYEKNNNCGTTLKGPFFYISFFIFPLAFIFIGACSNDMGPDKVQSEVHLVFEKINIHDLKGGKLLGMPTDRDAVTRDIESVAKNKFFDVFANLRVDSPGTNNFPRLQLSVDMSRKRRSVSFVSDFKTTVTLKCFDISGRLVGTLYVKEDLATEEFDRPVNSAMHSIVRKVRKWPQLKTFTVKKVAPSNLVVSSDLSNKLPISKTTRIGPTNRFAVIIGISKYQHSGRNGLNDLIFADDDAKAFAQSLQNLGWNESHIKSLTNQDATQRNIMIALESWLSKAGPNDQIVLFWAGHGFPDPEDPEKVYFACYDTDINIPATGYRMDKVRTALEEKKSKNVIVLADTCHAGKLITRGNRGISIVPNIKEQNTPKGWVFMVGADTDRQAVEHSAWSNGAFTHSLIKGLSGKADGFQSAGAKDGIVTMGELKDYMKTAMPDETQKVLGVAKHPVITTSTGDPNIWNLTLQVTQ